MTSGAFLTADPLPAVNDGIHNRIQIETELEREIIDHDFFQRLRRIKQLGFSYYVFPNANHTRFEHGLGAMHLAGEFWEAILKNTKEIIEKANSKGKKLNHEWEKYFSELDGKKKEIKQILRLCALIHDLGHGPFSHLFEEFSPTWLEFSNIPNWLFPKKGKRSERVPHELYSVLLLREILKDIKRENLPPHWLKDDLFLKFFAKVTCDDIQLDLGDEELGVLVGIKLPLGSLQIVKSLISGMVDVDRMDYLYRDSFYAGVRYGIFDIIRIKESLVICKESDSHVRMGLRHSGLSAFEHYLFCLYQMYVQIYFHKTVSACNSMLLFIHHTVEDEASTALKEFKEKYLLDVRQYGRLDESEFIKVYKALAESTSARDVSDDLFVKRKLWKRVAEINEDKHSEHIQDIVSLLRQNQITEFICDTGKARSLLKGLECQGQKDSLVVLERHLKLGEPKLEKLIEVSELANLYYGRRYKFHRIYAPRSNEDRLKNIIKAHYSLG